jgi:hypothetical protein
VREVEQIKAERVEAEQVEAERACIAIRSRQGVKREYNNATRI